MLLVAISVSSLVMWPRAVLLRNPPPSDPVLMTTVVFVRITLRIRLTTLACVVYCKYSNLWACVGVCVWGCVCVKWVCVGGMYMWISWIITTILCTYACKELTSVACIDVQWKPSIVATLGEQHFDVIKIIGVALLRVVLTQTFHLGPGFRVVIQRWLLFRGGC